MFKTVEHKLGAILFKYIDRLNDLDEDDTAHKIVMEMLPEMDAMLSVHDGNDGYSKWYCRKCRALSPSGSVTCHCWDNTEWLKEKVAESNDLASIDVQPIMWLVFEYAKIMNGFNELNGEERTERRNAAYDKDGQIRNAIRKKISDTIKDATRYRFLRDGDFEWSDETAFLKTTGGWLLTDEDLDIAVDALMNKIKVQNEHQ